MKSANCLFCGKVFKYYISCSTGKYCNSQCYNTARKVEKETCICLFCKKEFKVYKFPLGRYKSGVYFPPKFCCHQCYFKYPKSESFRIFMRNRNLQLKHWQGDKNPNWKGGITKEFPRLLKAEYKDWRRKIFERDKFTCIICGEKNFKNKGKTTYLEAHHIKSWKDFPELRYDLDNGQTLCLNCHNNTRRELIKQVIFGLYGELPDGEGEVF